MAATGAEIANAYVTITTRMPGISKQISKTLGGSDVRGALDRGGRTFGSVLAGAVGGAVAAVTSKAISTVMSSIDGAVKRVDTMNNFPKIMKNLGYSAGDAEKSIKKMSDRLTGLPTSLDSMAGMVQQLAPLTGGLDEATELSLGLNNALLAGGKPAEQRANAMEQYTQMLAVGKVDMAAWRSMVSAMPGQMDQLSVALLGAGNKSMDLYEAMKTGEVGFDDFNDAILKLNSEGVGNFASFEKQARDSTDGIGTGFANLQTAITRNLATVIEKLRPFIDAFITGATEIANVAGPLVVSAIDGILDAVGWVQDNFDWIGPVAAGLGAVAAGFAVMNAASTVAAAGGLMKWMAATKIGTAIQAGFNAVMAMNPIGLVVTAIAALVAGLVYFFTQTETGKKAWAAFTQFLSEAWANVSQFFQDVWNNVLKPVFDGIAAVFTWLWQNVLEPQMNAMKLLFAVVGGIFMGIYDVFVKPALEAIGAMFSWLWNNVIKPVAGWIGKRIQVLGVVVRFLWVKYVQPALKKIGDIFKWVWDNVIKPVAGWVGKRLETMGAAFRLVWDAVRSAWNNITDKIRSGWSTIKGIIDRLVSVVKSDPKKAFEAARDAVGKAWKGIQDLAKKPVKFVINTVIGGMIDTINKFLPKKWELTKPQLPKGFSEGGYTGNIAPNAVAGVVHGNEHVIRAQSRKAIEARHPGLLDHMNRYGSVPGYRTGGFVTPMRRGSYSISRGYYPGHSGIDYAAPTGTPIAAAKAGRVFHAGWAPGGGAYQVRIAHDGGINTWYLHMSKVLAKQGEQVRKNQKIGLVGSTGNSTGPHLHFSMLRGNWPNHFDPAPYLSGHAVPAGGGGRGGALSAVSGLAAWVTTKLAGAGGGVWGQVGKGLAVSISDKVIDAAKSLIPIDAIGGPTLYDRGGWLDPGTHLVQNKTRKPEPILTGAQWDAMRKSAERPTQVVQNNDITMVERDPRLVMRQLGRELEVAL